MKNLRNIVSKFHEARILVIGDLILDQYIMGDVDRVSPEAPVPVVWAKKRVYIPGGAANVANNISAFGARVCLAGVAGMDEHAKMLFSELKSRRISAGGIFQEAGRQTTLKTRVISGHQQVVRVDWEDVSRLKSRTKDKLQDFIQKELKHFDACIIEDYGKGLLDSHLLRIIKKEASKSKKVLTVDPKEENFEYYDGVTCITPNRKETENAVRYLKIKDSKGRFKIYNDKLVTNKDIENAGRAILKHLNLESLLITLGEHGMCLFEKNKKSPEFIPTVAQEVFDVSGAGDTVISTFTLALCCGADKLEAAHIANFAAGIVVGKAGTATTNKEELLTRLK